MTTSEHTLRDAQRNGVEEAEPRSYNYGKPGRTAIARGPPGRKSEDKEENVPEDSIREEEDGEEEIDDVPPRLASLPEIPTGDDLKFDFDSFSFLRPSTSEVEAKVNKRASNVMKLTQENEKLQAQLKAMAEQLEAMERQRAQLAAKEQNVVGKSSS